jgi:hypothetical protein
MKKILLLSFLATTALFTITPAHAQESFPEIHNDPIKIHLIDAQDGSPIANLRVLLAAGYSQYDLRKGLWREEATSDAQGDIKLPRTMLNLGFLQILVAQNKPCTHKQSVQSLSIERIRIDGFSAPNHCGPAVADEKPGELNFFVRKLPVVEKKNTISTTPTSKIPTAKDYANDPAEEHKIAAVDPTKSTKLLAATQE